MNDIPQWPSRFTSRDGDTDPLAVCHPARVHAVPRGSSRATAAEQALVQRLPHHDLGPRDRVRTTWSCQARAALHFQHLKVGAIVDSATGVPETNLAPHRPLPDVVGPPTPVIYANADHAAHEQAALPTRHASTVAAVSADIRAPRTACSAVLDTGLIPSGRPVAFPAVGLADHVAEPAALTRTMTGLTGVIPASSLPAITHRSDTTHHSDTVDDPQPDCRADLADLLQGCGWELQKAVTLATLWRTGPHDARYGSTSVASEQAELPPGYTDAGADG